MHSDILHQYLLFRMYAFVCASLPFSVSILLCAFAFSILRPSVQLLVCTLLCVPFCDLVPHLASERVPFIASPTSFLASDLDVPGLPIRKRGIFSSRKITIISTFSLSIPHFAIP